jgi:hypothetical protein
MMHGMTVAICLVFALLFSQSRLSAAFANWCIFLPGLAAAAMFFSGAEAAKGVLVLGALVAALKLLKAFLDWREHRPDPSAARPPKP